MRAGWQGGGRGYQSTMEAQLTLLRPQLLHTAWPATSSLKVRTRKLTVISHPHPVSPCYRASCQGNSPAGSRMSSCTCTQPRGPLACALVSVVWEPGGNSGGHCVHPPPLTPHRQIQLQGNTLPYLCLLHHLIPSHPEGESVPHMDSRRLGCGIYGCSAGQVTQLTLWPGPHPILSLAHSVQILRLLSGH